MNTKKGLNASMNIKNNQKKLNDPVYTSTPPRLKNAPSSKPNSSPNTQYSSNLKNSPNNNAKTDQYSSEPKDPHSINLGDKLIRVESMIDQKKPSHAQNPKSNTNLYPSKTERITKSPQVNKKPGYRDIRKVPSDTREKCNIIENLFNKLTKKRYDSCFEAILWISEHDVLNTNLYVGKTYKSGKLTVKAKGSSSFNEVHKTPEKLVLQPLGLHHTPSDSESSKRHSRSPSKGRTIRSQRSKAVTLASSYVINKNSTASNYLNVDNNHNDLVVSGQNTVQDIDRSRRKINLRNRSKSRSSYHVGNRISNLSDMNMGSDFEYAEESEEEDKIVKISVKFKNDDLDKKIQALGLEAKNMNDMENEMQNKRKKLEIDEEALKVQESQCSIKLQKIEARKKELELTQRENDKLRKSYEKKAADISEKSLEMDSLTEEIKSKMEILKKEQDELNLKEGDLRKEIAKNKEKQKIVDTKEQQIKDITTKLESKTNELHKIESSWKDNEIKLEKQYKTKIQKNEEKVSDLETKSKNLDGQVKQTNKMLSDKKDEIKDLENQVSRLNQQVSSTDKYQDRKNKEAVKKGKDIDKLNQDVRNMNDQIKKLKSDLESVKKSGFKQKCFYIVNKIHMNLQLPSLDRMISNKREFVRKWISENSDIVAKNNKEIRIEKLKIIYCKNDLKLMAKAFSHFSLTAKKFQAESELKKQQEENLTNKQTISELKILLIQEKIDEKIKWKMFSMVLKVSEQKHFVSNYKSKKLALEILRKYCISQNSKPTNLISTTSNMNYTMGGYLLNKITKRVIIKSLHESFTEIYNRAVTDQNPEKAQITANQFVDSEYTEEIILTDNLSISKKLYETPVNTNKYENPANTDYSIFKLEDTKLNSEIQKQDHFNAESHDDVNEKINQIGDFADSPTNPIDTLKYSTSPDASKINFGKKNLNPYNNVANENVALKPSPSENNINSTSKRTSQNISDNLQNVKSEENLHIDSHKTSNHTERNIFNEQPFDSSNLVDSDLKDHPEVFKKNNDTANNSVFLEKSQNSKKTEPKSKKDENLNNDISNKSLVSKSNKNNESFNKQSETNSSIIEESFIKDEQSLMYQSPTLRKQTKVNDNDFNIEIKNNEDNKDFEGRIQTEIESRIKQDTEEQNLDQILKNEFDSQEANKGFISKIFTKFSNLCSCKKEEDQSLGSLTSFTETTSRTNSSSKSYINSNTGSYINSYTGTYSEYSRSDKTSQMTSLQEIQESARTISKLGVIVEEEQFDKNVSIKIENDEKNL